MDSMLAILNPTNQTGNCSKEWQMGAIPGSADDDIDFDLIAIWRHEPFLGYLFESMSKCGDVIAEQAF